MSCVKKINYELIKRYLCGAKSDALYKKFTSPDPDGPDND